MSAAFSPASNQQLRTHILRIPVKPLRSSYAALYYAEDLKLQDDTSKLNLDQSIITYGSFVVQSLSPDILF